MGDVSVIAEKIRDGVPEILKTWRAGRERAAGEEFDPRFVEEVGRVLVIFTEFLQSPEPIEAFTREGATRAVVGEISTHQYEIGRDAVEVIEDYASLRRCVWRFVEEKVDLSSFDGGEVSRFFIKLMQASDWITESGLRVFDEIAHQHMESALGQAAATDILTGLPGRELFDRRLLPLAVEEHDQVALVIFDVAHFSETVAFGGIAKAREALLRLAKAVEETAPEEAVRARFGDDEICVILPGASAEEAYHVSAEVLARLEEGAEALPVDAGVAVYPKHGDDASGLVTSAFRALGMAKRVGGSGIVVAR